jgi:hypothetical protein
VTRRNDDDDQKQARHECVYTGPHEETSLEPLDPTPIAPSEDVVRAVALSVLCEARGSMRSLPHFKQRMKTRNFEIFDMIYVIKNGECVKAQYCPDFKNHKFTFRGLIDGVEFDAAFALSPSHDFVKAPLLYLISGCWKTSNGARAFRY